MISSDHFTALRAISAYVGCLRIDSTLLSLLDVFCDLFRSSQFSTLRPIQSVLQKLQPFVNKIKGIFDKYLSSWWLRRLLSAVMWPIEKAVNVILYPFRDTIQRVIEKLNPFSAFDQIFNPLLSPLDFLPSTVTLIRKLDFIESFGSSSSFDKITQPMMNIVAIILRGSYGMMSGMLQQSVESVEFFEQMLGGSDSDIMQSFMSLLQEKENINPLYKMSDLILELKAEEVDSKVFMCDNYLRANTGIPLSHQDTSADNKMLNILGDGTDFDILPCIVDVAKDSLTPFFEHGTPASSWFMAPLTLLLHHASITQKAVEAGIIPSEHEVKTVFVPTVDSNTGKCTVKLFPRVSRTESTTYTTNTNLPIGRVTLENIGNSSLDNLPTLLTDYIQERISSPVSDIFARNYSWALVEKVMICKVIQGNWDNGSIATGMHLLSGNLNGVCYSKSGINSKWKLSTIKETHGSGGVQYDDVMLTPSLSDFDDDSLFELLKKRTMSMSQIDILHSLDSESSGSDRSEIEDALQDFSMFIVKKDDHFYPIFYTDETADEDILAVYVDGVKIQPLYKNDFKSNSVTEVWEYKITGDFGDIKPQEGRPLNKLSVGYWEKGDGYGWEQIAQSETINIVNIGSSSSINVELHFKDKASQPPVDEYKLWLDGKSWNGSTWLDKSSNDYAIETHGTINKAGEKSNEMTYLYGDTSSGVTIKEGWPSGSDYTFIHVTKYNGATRERIWNGTTGNWLSGHDNGKRGLFHHGSDVTQYSKSVGIVDSWGIFTDRMNSSGSNVRVDGVDVTTNSSPKYNPDSIGINPNTTEYDDRSDWASAMVLVYDRYLSDDEVRAVEAWIRTTYPFPNDVPDEDPNEGFVNLALLDKSGNEIANANVGRGSQHLGSNISKTFDKNHDLVKQCEPGFKYILKGTAGGEGGHKIYIENIEVEFNTFAYVNLENMSILQTSRGFGIQSIQPVSSGILKRGFVEAAVFTPVDSVRKKRRVIDIDTVTSSGELSFFDRLVSREKREQSSQISRSIQTTNNSGSMTTYSMKKTFSGRENVMTMVMDELVKSAGVILVENKNIKVGDYVLFKGTTTSDTGVVKHINLWTDGRPKSYTIFNTETMKMHVKVEPKNIRRKLKPEEEQQPQILQEAKQSDGNTPLFRRNNEDNKKIQWADGTKEKRQKEVPNWGMTLKQFREYVYFCMKYDKTFKMPTSSLWYSQAYKYDALLNKNKGYVDLEDMNNAFIIPQTRGTGMSVALNMQEGRKSKSAEVMVSHAWREDMHQVLLMLEKAKGTRLQSGEKFNDNTVIWFCAFAQYQANDTKENPKFPSVSDQVALEPFGQVIESNKVKDMFVIQTKTFDPYSRMWCVIELGEALNKKENTNNFKIHPLFSRQWLVEYVKHTGTLAKTWGLEGGEYVYKSSYTIETEERRIAVDRGQGLDRDKNDIKKYYLIGRDEKGEDPKTKKEEPKLKTNVREGLTMYGLYKDIRQSDQEVFDTIEGKFESREGLKDGWERIQHMIVDFQEEAALQVYRNHVGKW